MHSVGWVDPDRPLVLLFLGSSGVGKTEVAKQVAMEKKCEFIWIDMSEYQRSHTATNLTGSLPKAPVIISTFIKRLLMLNLR